MGAGAPGKLGLSRESRIKHGRDFARARTQGKRIANGCLVANWLDLLDRSGDAARIAAGFITSVEYRQRFRN